MEIYYYFLIVETSTRASSSASSFSNSFTPNSSNLFSISYDISLSTIPCRYLLIAHCKIPNKHLTSFCLLLLSSHSSPHFCQFSNKCLLLLNNLPSLCLIPEDS